MRTDLFRTRQCHTSRDGDLHRQHRKSFKSDIYHLLQKQSSPVTCLTTHTSRRKLNLLLM